MADTRPAALSAVAILLLAAGGWAAYSTDLLRTHPAQATTASIKTGTASVTRMDVRQQNSVFGTLGYAGNYSVIAPTGSVASGAATGSASVITWLPAVGATVRRGEPAYAVGGLPVRLFYGGRPAWRDMAPGIAPGRDVRQLQRNLAALGYGSGLGLVADGQFDTATQVAVERWQQAKGLPVTGTVPLGQVVFLPGPLLVSQQVAVAGGPVPNGTPILQGTSTRPVVQMALDPSVVPTLRRGNRIIVTLPDGSADPGVITQVSRVAQIPSSSSQGQQGPGNQQPPTVPVTARLVHPVRGALDQAQVQVAITSAEHRGVLAVPITALLPQPGGRFAVVVVSSTAGRTLRRTVPVQTGLFDDVAGMVEVSGPGLVAGQHVAVPSP
jgi:peptidoglycan hydrolase-like protein with peptidoglycan-binding domain